MKLRLLPIALVSLLPLACGGDSDAEALSGTTILPQQEEHVEFVQVDRVGRPLVPEALIVSAERLAAFNGKTPAEDAAPAAEDIRTEAGETLRALGNSAPRTADILDVYFPDVVRIDTRLPTPLGREAFTNQLRLSGLSNVPVPVAGRRIEDDVADFMIELFTGRTLRTDNVFFTGVRGNNAQPSIPLLLEQRFPGGPAQFPFLPAPH